MFLGFSHLKFAIGSSLVDALAVSLATRAKPKNPEETSSPEPRVARCAGKVRRQPIVPALLSARGRAGSRAALFLCSARSLTFVEGGLLKTSDRKGLGTVQGSLRPLHSAQKRNRSIAYKGGTP
jgi:hypothetical protein